MRPVALQPGRRERRLPGSRATTHRNIPMLDLLMLALALGFFVAGIGYAYACERL
jgi:cell division protein FtsN